MTEVPEKETEGAPRRRRGGRYARSGARRPVARSSGAESIAQAELVAMPGERLSRVGATGIERIAEAEVFVDEEADTGDGAQPAMS